MKKFLLVTIVLLFTFLYDSHINAQTSIKKISNTSHSSTPHRKKNKSVKKLIFKKEAKIDPYMYIYSSGPLLDEDVFAQRRIEVSPNIQTIHTDSFRILESVACYDTHYIKHISYISDTTVHKVGLFKKKKEIHTKEFVYTERNISEYYKKEFIEVSEIPKNIDMLPSLSGVTDYSVPVIFHEDFFSESPEELYLTSLNLSETEKVRIRKSIEFDTCGCSHLRDQYTEAEPLMRIALLDPFKFKCALWKAYHITGVTVDAQIKVFFGESHLFPEAVSSSKMLFYNGASRETFSDAGLNRDSAWRNLNPYKIVITLAKLDRVRLMYNKRLKKKFLNHQDITFEDYGPFNMAPSVTTGDKLHAVYKKGTVEYANNVGVDRRGNNDGKITEGEIIKFYQTVYTKSLHQYLPEYNRIASRTNDRSKRARVAGIKLKKNRNLDISSEMLAVSYRNIY